MKYLKLGNLCMLLGLMLFLACNDPVSTNLVFNPDAGTWQFSGSIANNTCFLLFTDSLYRLNDVISETLNITRQDIWLASHQAGNFYAPGTVFHGNKRQSSFWFTIDAPRTQIHNGCSFLIKGETTVFLDTDTTGTGSLTLSAVTYTPGCRSCAVLATGTWQKISEAIQPISRAAPTPTPIPTPIPIRSPKPTPIPTVTPVPMATPPLPTPTPEPGYFLFSANPSTLQDTTPNSTTNLTICTRSPRRAGVPVTVEIINGSGLLSSGTLVQTVVTNVSGCALETFTEQGISTTTVQVLAPGYISRSLQIRVIP